MKNYLLDNIGKTINKECNSNSLKYGFGIKSTCLNKLCNECCENLETSKILFY